MPGDADDIIDGGVVVKNPLAIVFSIGGGTGSSGCGEGMIQSTTPPVGLPQSPATRGTNSKKCNKNPLFIIIILRSVVGRFILPHCLFLVDFAKTLIL
jgi:hypothetical protein